MITVVMTMMMKLTALFSDSCVEDEDKGLALGVVTVFISLFGLIPSPIMLGAVIGVLHLTLLKRKCDMNLHLFPLIYFLLNLYLSVYLIDVINSQTLRASCGIRRVE